MNRSDDSVNAKSDGPFAHHSCGWRAGDRLCPGKAARDGAAGAVSQFVYASFMECGGDMVLRTGPAGWTLGKGVEVRYGGTVCRGLISERMNNLDTGDGARRVEVVVELSE